MSFSHLVLLLEIVPLLSLLSCVVLNIRAVPDKLLLLVLSINAIDVKLHLQLTISINVNS